MQILQRLATPHRLQKTGQAEMLDKRRYLLTLY